VSGEAHTQPVQPFSQVPVIGSGSWHLGPLLTGPGTSQQIWPASQHVVPQQNCIGVQATPLQGGIPHVPMSQEGGVPVHLLPQVPRWRMSFFRLTQALPQQPTPGLTPPHCIGLQVPPELLVDELAEELVLVDELEVVVIPVLVEELALEVVEPPP